MRLLRKSLKTKSEAVRDANSYGIDRRNENNQIGAKRWNSHRPSRRWDWRPWSSRTPLPTMGLIGFKGGEGESRSVLFFLTNEVTRLNISDDVLLFILADAWNVQPQPVFLFIIIIIFFFLLDSGDCPPTTFQWFNNNTIRIWILFLTLGRDCLGFTVLSISEL